MFKNTYICMEPAEALAHLSPGSEIAAMRRTRHGELLKLPGALPELGAGVFSPAQADIGAV